MVKVFSTAFILGFIIAVCSSRADANSWEHAVYLGVAIGCILGGVALWIKAIMVELNS